MNKYLIVIGITLMLLVVGFSGCTQQIGTKSDDNGFENNYPDEQDNNNQNNDEPTKPTGIEATGDTNKAVILSYSPHTKVAFYKTDEYGLRHRAGEGGIDELIDYDYLDSHPILPPEAGEVEYVIEYYKIEGTVQNIADDMLNQITIKVMFYDKYNNYLGSKSDLTQYLPKDKIWNFEVSLPDITNVNDVYFDIAVS